MGNTKLEQTKLVSRIFAAIRITFSASLSGIVMLLTMMFSVVAGADYFPGQNWQSKSPAAAGFVPPQPAAVQASGIFSDEDGAETDTASDDPLGMLMQYSGVIVLGLAGVILLGGIVGSIIVRRR